MGRPWRFSTTAAFLVLSLFAAVDMSPAAAAETLGYVDLVNRLTDLEHLATLPAPGEKCVQWSSYDRRSKYDEASGKYIDWAANGDGTGIIRKEGDDLVFAEMEGPGVIWRIWSALAKEGHVKIYLDGAENPAVDLPFIGYFNLENEPFTYPALVHTTARGLNCYVPIPYRKSCKIVATGDWGRYFHFTYTTYPAGTILPTFTRELSTAESRALDKADKMLTECGARQGDRRPGETIIKQGPTVVAPGDTATVARLRGRRAITALRAYMDLDDSPEDCNVLRELVLSIRWDGESQPSVWTPLGDFFGTAAGANKYDSLPLGVTDQGFYSNWYMPFERSALIELTNDGDKERRVRFDITHAPLTKPIDTLGRFHAKWHRDAFAPEEPERRAIDWTIWPPMPPMPNTLSCGVSPSMWCGSPMLLFADVQNTDLAQACARCIARWNSPLY